MDTHPQNAQTHEHKSPFVKTGLLQTFFITQRDITVTDTFPASLSASKWDIKLKAAMTCKDAIL